MRAIAACAVFAPASCFAQELLSLEIVGPTSVFEQNATQYQCIAHYDIGAEDVTMKASWAVAPSGLADIDNGLLEVGDFLTDVSFAVTAAFQDGDQEAAAFMEITASASELGILRPLDPDADAQFGASVAMSESFILVGASHDDDNGAAYLFDRDDGQQLAKLVAEDGESGDRFGIAVAIEGQRAVIGAFLADAPSFDSGAAYVFDISNPAAPQQLAKIVPEDVSVTDTFGRDVALYGDLVLIGAGEHDGRGCAGSVYVFDISNAGSPVQLSKFCADDAMPGDLFGRYTIAVSNGIALVGSARDDDQGSQSGSVYAFDISDPQNPIQIAKFTPAGVDMDDEFGKAISFNESIALIGAPGDSSGDNPGAVYVYDLAVPATPLELAKIESGQDDDLFGWAMDVDGPLAVIGAWKGGASGMAYLFDISNPADPTLITPIEPQSLVSSARFGISVRMDGSTAVVGATYDFGGEPQSGTAHVLDLNVAPDCNPDLTGDGKLDILDFILFQQSWTAGISTGDCDDNDVLNVLDFVCYQQQFTAGCK